MPPIPGTADAGNPEENVAAGAITFDDAIRATLDAAPSWSGDIAPDRFTKS